METKNRTVELLGISFLMSLTSEQKKRLQLAKGEVANSEQLDLAAKILGFEKHSNELNHATVLARLSQLSMLPLVSNIPFETFKPVFDAVDVLMS